MDRTDADFRKGCQQWHSHFLRCTDASDTRGISVMRRHLREWISKWQERLAAVREGQRKAASELVEWQRKEASAVTSMRMLLRLEAEMAQSVRRLDRVRSGDAGKAEEAGGENEQ